MRKKQAQKKNTSLGPYINTQNIERPLLGLENLPILKELYPGNGWVTHANIIENPVNKGHDLCFDKTRK